MNLRQPWSARRPVSPEWSKADLHIHTTFSDGLMTPAEMVDYIVQETDLRVIAITDHDTAEGAFVTREYAERKGVALDVIIGQEVTTREGDVLGLFLTSSLPIFDTAAEAIAAIHAQGGLAVAAHPMTFGWRMESVGMRIRHLPFDAVEVRHGCPLSFHSNIITGLVNKFGQQLPAVANSDAHVPFVVGEPFTWFPGQTSADLRRAIEENTVRMGGKLWSLSGVWKLRQTVKERGWPYHDKPKHKYQGSVAESQS